MSGRRRRSRAPGGRPFEYLVSFSVEEAAVIAAAAAREDMAVGAWIGEAAERTARAETMPVSSPGETMQALMRTRAEASENRRLLRNIAGNLNDVARHANVTGALPPDWPRRVLGQVETVTDQVAGLVRQLDELTAIARRRITG